MPRTKCQTLGFVISEDLCTCVSLWSVGGGKSVSLGEVTKQEPPSEIHVTLQILNRRFVLQLWLFARSIRAERVCDLL